MFRPAFVCSLISLVAAFAVADDLVVRQSRPQKLLVLTNGQVFGGQLISRTDGYDVILPNGRMYVSSDRIRFLATSMQDAYEKMSDSVQHKTPANHVEMARWCYNNGLMGSARRELLDALHLDPDFRLAQSMLAALTREAKQVEAKAKSTEEILTKMSAQRLGVTDRRSLGGLPVQTARDFTIRIQTLLSNKCGNAKCHSGGRSEFQFVNTRRSSSVVIAEQNLASILKQIDLNQPESSPLLVKAESMHGGARSPLFSGRAGGSQLQLLKDWVHEVSSELNPTVLTSAVQNPAVSNPISGVRHSTVSMNGYQRAPDVRNNGFSAVNQASLETNRSEVKRSIEDDHELMNVPGMPSDGIKVQTRSKTETDGKFGQAALEAVRDNPFDPMIFNRRYHGHARSSR